MPLGCNWPRLEQNGNPKTWNRSHESYRSFSYCTNNNLLDPFRTTSSFGHASNIYCQKKGPSGEQKGTLIIKGITPCSFSCVNFLNAFSVSDSSKRIAISQIPFLMRADSTLSDDHIKKSNVTTLKQKSALRIDATLEAPSVCRTCRFHTFKSLILETSSSSTLVRSLW